MPCTVKLTLSLVIIMLWRKLVRRIFILSQFALALNYSSQALQSWSNHPVVTSISLRSITDVSFPAISICHDIDSWKWPGIVSAMVDSDKNNTIENIFLYNQDLFYNLLNKIKPADMKLKKSKKFMEVKNETSLNLAKALLPKQYEGVVELVHFVVFSENNQYKLYGFYRGLVKDQLLYKLQKMEPEQVASAHETKLCTGGTSYINATDLCLQWKNETLNQLEYQTWRNDCFTDSDCLKSGRKGSFKNAIIDLVLMDILANSQNILDYFIAENLELVHKFESISNLASSLQKPSVLAVWSFLNGGFNKAEERTFKAVEEQWTDELELSVNELDRLIDLFTQPKIHGDMKKEYVLIPLCSFGHPKMVHCDDFKRTSHDFDRMKCFTFDEKFVNQTSRGKIGPENGLNVLVSFRIPSTLVGNFKKNIKPLKLILHEPGSVVDKHYRTNTFHEIQPGKHYIIGAEATVLEVTDGFEDISKEKRKCEVKSETNNYHQANCYFNELVKVGINKCHCIPWYMKQANTTTKVCVLEKFNCFEDLMKDTRIQNTVLEKCLPSCNYIKYKSHVLKEETLDLDYLEYEEVKADMKGAFLEGITGDHPYRSLIQVNFADPKATVITQDAKVTFADMLGNIGGTFGVFLGLSFVSLVDELVEFLHYFYNHLNHFKTK